MSDQVNKYEGMSDVMVVKQYFTPPVPSNGELLALKRSDEHGIKTLATGIRNGSLTY